MRFWITFGRTRRGVDVQAAKVSAIVQRLSDRQISEVLVAESNNLALSDKAS
jgi:ribosomal protein L12E/L44/L45/RPP1/RPP2